MTERLYYIHPIIASCEAEVVSCEKRGGGYAAVLDRTIIFPEGGGQPADRGTVGDAAIIDAREEHGEVVHIIDRELAPGSRVKVELDLARRLDHSEQHTGEHVLSGLAWKLFGTRNVGFHMAEDYCTIDLDKFLGADELALLEEEANRAVRRDLPVTEIHTDEAGLAALSLRKKSDAAVGDIRIVYIAGGEVDSCTCCGTHCASTGEVGFIRIADSQKYKGGTRLWFSCGGRAVKEANALTRELTELARSYSTSRGELPGVLRAQSGELSLTKRELKARTAALCSALAEGTGRLAVKTQAGFSMEDVKLFTEALVEKGADIALVFGEKDGRVSYRALRREGVKAPMNELIKAVNGLVLGKGGGSPAFAQGSTAERVTEEMLETLRKLVRQWS